MRGGLHDGHHRQMVTMTSKPIKVRDTLVAIVLTLLCIAVIVYAMVTGQVGSPF